MFDPGNPKIDQAAALQKFQRLVTPHPWLRRSNSLQKNRLVNNIATTLSLDAWSQSDDENAFHKKNLGINFLCMHPDKEGNATSAPNSKPDISVASRYQEIFMDLVVMKHSLRVMGSRFILDPRFSANLSESDKSFKNHIIKFLDTMPEEAKKSAAWDEMNENLVNMGLDTDNKNKEYTVTSLGNMRPRSKSQSQSQSPSAPKPTKAKSPSPPAAPNTTPTPGHVFIVNNSVCCMYVDAFLAPVDFMPSQARLPAGTIHTAWRHQLAERDPQLFNELIPTKTKKDLHDDPQHKLARFYKNWPFDRFKADRLKAIPLIVLGHVGFNVGKLNPEEHVALLMETVSDFVDLTIKHLRSIDYKPLARKKKYVLALPVLGTGYGNATDITGDVLEAILKLSSRLVAENDDLDIVLTCADSATFCMAQSLRRNMMKEDENLWPSFRQLKGDDSSNNKLRDAAELAALAAKKKLSIFIGAGVSIGAGGLSWFALLEKIEMDFQSPPSLQNKYRGKDDSALLVADELNNMCAGPDTKNVTKSLKTRIADLCNRPFPSLLMALLASLQPRGAITQNYDFHAEIALNNVNIAKRTRNETVSIIPYSPIKGATTWLLKMHGCVSAKDDIVITKEDFDRFEESRLKANGGLLQAELMTSHMLFVGFSMTDANYLRIISEVRAALNKDCDSKPHSKSQSNSTAVAGNATARAPTP
ncbi:hypothetical protein TrST_g11019 [Triparma strigata]|uniref:SIR2-like domain-containing protein n=1 Tax=Triparma strigata TaxID=1606541 RepID=A0A9W6ZI28_9STRA|nr:hypothetical protein TrST_g11019 [Triparma strigata]